MHINTRFQQRTVNAVNTSKIKSTHINLFKVSK